MKAALGWEAGKAKSAAKGLAGEAHDYLAASRERGDAYIAGKTERHEAGGIGIGMIYTEIDRAFVIVAENSERLPEFRFHHLERRRLGDALPDLLEAALAEGLRVVVQGRGGRSAQRAAMDLPRGQLSAARRRRRRRPRLAAGLPHRIGRDAQRRRLRVLLEPADAARFRSADCERVIVLFEARDEALMAAARTAWKTLRDAGAAPSYWREGDEGEWVKAR